MERNGSGHTKRGREQRLFRLASARFSLGHPQSPPANPWNLRPNHLAQTLHACRMDRQVDAVLLLFFSELSPGRCATRSTQIQSSGFQTNSFVRRSVLTQQEVVSDPCSRLLADAHGHGEQIMFYATTAKSCVQTSVKPWKWPSGIDRQIGIGSDQLQFTSSSSRDSGEGEGERDSRSRAVGGAPDLDPPSDPVDPAATAHCSQPRPINHARTAPRQSAARAPCPAQPEARGPCFPHVTLAAGGGSGKPSPHFSPYFISRGTPPPFLYRKKRKMSRKT